MPTEQKIVGATSRLEDMSTAKLARWVRCLFQMALPSHVSTAEEILEQVVGVCQDLKRVSLARIVDPFFPLCSPFSLPPIIKPLLPVDFAPLFLPSSTLF